MQITVKQTEKLLLEGELKFKSLALSMLLTNLKSIHVMSPEMYPLEECAASINKFLAKYDATTLGPDAEILAKL
jgi:hypothetical protein